MHRDQLPIAEPCTADWSGMSGDDKRRFCGQCTKHVHDLSAMRQPEAEALVASGDDLCVRYEAEPDGSIRHRSRRRAIRAAVGAMLMASAPALASSAPAEAHEGPSWLDRIATALKDALGVDDEPQVLLGAIASVEVVPDEVDEEPPWEGELHTIPEVTEAIPHPVDTPRPVVMGRVRAPSITPPLVPTHPVDAD